MGMSPLIGLCSHVQAVGLRSSLMEVTTWALPPYIAA